LVINCGMQGKKENSFSAGWWTKPIIKASKTLVDFIPNHRSHQRVPELKPSANYDNLYYAGFSRAIGDWLWECHAFYRKTWRIQTSLSIEGANPNIGNGVTDLKKSRILNQPYWECKLISRHAFQLWRTFWKRRWWNLANKVKESEFEIVSVEKKRQWVCTKNYLI
jgi:DNA topoisomerase-3